MRKKKKNIKKRKNKIVKKTSKIKKKSLKKKIKIKKILVKKIPKNQILGIFGLFLEFLVGFWPFFKDFGRFLAVF